MSQEQSFYPIILKEHRIYTFLKLLCIQSLELSIYPMLTETLGFSCQFLLFGTLVFLDIAQPTQQSGLECHLVYVYGSEFPFLLL